MAKSYNLTLQMNLQGPSNVKSVANKLKKELSGIGGIKLEINQKSLASLDKATKKLKIISAVLTKASADATSLQQAFTGLSTALGKSASAFSAANRNLKDVTSGLNKTADSASKAQASMSGFIRTIKARVAGAAAFQIINKAIALTGNLLNDAATQFVTYERNLNRVKQVTRDSDITIKDLSKTIRSLAGDLGVSSQELSQVSVTLAQAGLAATQVKQALKTLAQASLTPTFTNMNDAVEGAIAIMSQFNITAGGLEKSFDSINTVASQFAVEFDDIVSAIQRGGGAFAAAASDAKDSQEALNQYIALFTTVRATTRESSETIATGLRTITARLQKLSTQKKIKDLIGVDLTDAQGNFVGAYTAIDTIAQKIKDLNLASNDPRFAQLVESIGGIRQISRVIPLLTQVETRTRSYEAAVGGILKTSDTAAFAQDTLAVQLQKTREAWNDLVGSFASSNGFKEIAKLALSLTRSLSGLAKAFIPLAPLFAALAAGKAIKSVTGGGLLGGLLGGAGKRDGGYIQKFARGGVVPGSGNRDTVPAMLTPGEFVIRKNAVKALGTERLHKMNKYAAGGSIKDVDAVGVMSIYDRKKSGTTSATTIRDTISKQDILSQFPQPKKTKKGYTPAAQKRLDDRNFLKKSELKDLKYVGQTLPESIYQDFEEIMKKSLIDATNNAVSNLGSILGKFNLPAPQISDSASQKRFLSGINDAAIGNLYEQTLYSIKQGGIFTDDANPRAPFDFESGIGNLTALYPDLTMPFVDAKANLQAGLKNAIAKKVGNQYLLEANRLTGVGSENKDIFQKVLDRFSNNNEKIEGAALKSSGNITGTLLQEMVDAGKLRLTVGSRGKRFYEKLAKGGSVSDTVPAMLTPGEFVINKKAAARIGSAQLHKLNRADKISGFNKGGAVGTIQHFAGGGTALDILAESNGGIDKFSAELRKSIRDLAKGIGEAVRKSKDDFILGVSRAEASVAAGGSRKKANKELGNLVEEMAKAAGIKNKTLIGGAKTELTQGLKKGNSIDDVINNSTNLSRIFKQVYTSSDALDKALTQLSVETGITKTELAKINTGGVLTKTFDRFKKGLDDLSDKIANSRVGTAFTSATKKFSGALITAGNTVQALTIATTTAIGAFNALFPNLGNTDAGKTAQETAGGAAAGAVAGGSIGRLFGPQGAALGAIVGAIAGGFNAYARSSTQRALEASQKDLTLTTERLDQAMKDLENSSALNQGERRKKAAEALGAQYRAARSQAVAGETFRSTRGVFDVGSYFAGPSNQQISESFDNWANGMITSLNAIAEFNTNILATSGNLQAMQEELELIRSVDPGAQQGERQAALLNGSLVTQAARVRNSNYDDATQAQQQEYREAALRDLAIAAYLDKKKLSGEERERTRTRIVSGDRGFENAIAEGEKEILRREELRLSILTTERAVNNLQKTMKDFNRFLDALSNANERYLSQLDIFEKRAQDRIDGVFGRGSAISTAGVEQQKAALENPLSLKEFRSAMESVFGADSELTNAAVAGRAAREGLSPLLQSTNENNRENVIQQVSDMIVASTGFASLDDMPKAVQNAVKSVIAQTRSTIENAPEGSDFAELGETIGSFIENNSQAATKAAIDAQNRFIKQLEFINKSIEKQIQIQQKVLSQSINASKINEDFNIQAMEALGLIPSLQDLNAGTEAEIRALSGGTLDPRQIGEEIGRRQRQNQQLQARQDELGREPKTDATVQELANLGAVMGQNNMEIQNQTAALELIESNTASQNNAFKKFAEDQKRAGDKRNIIDKILGGDINDIFEVQQDVTAAAAGLSGNTGYFAGRPDAFRRARDPNGVVASLGPQAQRAIENTAYAGRLRGIGADDRVFRMVEGIVTENRGNPNNVNFRQAQMERDRRLAANQQLSQLYRQQGQLNQEAIDAITGDPNLDPLTRQQLLMDSFFLKLNREYPGIVQAAYQSLLDNANELGLPAPVQRNTGGIIHSSGGGTGGPNRDTVPAMLTPGEFVVNREATQKNLGLLKSLNAGTQGGYNRGGVVYLNDGSDRPVGPPGSLQQSRSNLASRQEDEFFTMLFDPETYGGNPDYQNFEAQFAGKFGSTYGHPKFERYEKIFKEKQREGFKKGLDAAIAEDKAKREEAEKAAQQERDKIFRERLAAQQEALRAERERRAAGVAKIKLATERRESLGEGADAQRRENERYSNLPTTPMAATQEYLSRLDNPVDAFIYKSASHSKSVDGGNIGGNVQTLVPATIEDVFPGKQSVIVDKTKALYIRKHKDVYDYVMGHKQFTGLEPFNNQIPFEDHPKSVQDVLRAHAATPILMDDQVQQKVSSEGYKIYGSRENSASGTATTFQNGGYRWETENINQYVNPDLLLEASYAADYIQALNNSWETILRNRDIRETENQLRLEQIQEQERLKKEQEDAQERARLERLEQDAFNPSADFTGFGVSPITAQGLPQQMQAASQRGERMRQGDLEESTMPYYDANHGGLPVSIEALGGQGIDLYTPVADALGSAIPFPVAPNAPGSLGDYAQSAVSSVGKFLLQGAGGEPGVKVVYPDGTTLYELGGEGSAPLLLDLLGGAGAAKGSRAVGNLLRKLRPRSVGVVAPVNDAVKIPGMRFVGPGTRAEELGAMRANQNALKRSRQQQRLNQELFEEDLSRRARQQASMTPEEVVSRQKFDSQLAKSAADFDSGKPAKRLQAQRAAEAKQTSKFVDKHLSEVAERTQIYKAQKAAEAKQISEFVDDHLSQVAARGDDHIVDLLTGKQPTAIAPPKTRTPSASSSPSNAATTGVKPTTTTPTKPTDFPTESLIQKSQKNQRFADIGSPDPKTGLFDQGKKFRQEQLDELFEPGPVRPRIDLEQPVSDTPVKKPKPTEPKPLSNKRRLREIEKQIKAIDKEYNKNPEAFLDLIEKLRPLQMEQALLKRLTKRPLSSTIMRYISAFGGGVAIPVAAAANAYQQYPGVKEFADDIVGKEFLEYLLGKSETELPPASLFNRGGPVYANRGMFVPKGTDTVPAMLTPGEFVINRKAAQENRALLERINNGETLYRNQGGVIYRRFGGMTDESGAGGVVGGTVINLNMDQFNAAVTSFSGKVTEFKTGADSFVASVTSFTNKMNSFGTYVDKLSGLKIPTLPDQIYLFGTHTVNVTVTGAAAFEALEDKLKQLINKETGREMSRLWQQSGGALGSPP